MSLLCLSSTRFGLHHDSVKNSYPLVLNAPWASGLTAFYQKFRCLLANMKLCVEPGPNPDTYLSFYPLIWPSYRHQHLDPGCFVNTQYLCSTLGLPPVLSNAAAAQPVGFWLVVPSSWFLSPAASLVSTMVIAMQVVSVGLHCCVIQDSVKQP